MFCFARLILHPPFANLCPKKTVLDAHLQILHGSTRFAALDPIHNSQEISKKKKSVTFLRSQPPPSRGHPQTAARRVMNNLKLINFLFSRDSLPSSAFSSSADLWSTSIPLLHYLERARTTSLLLIAHLVAELLLLLLLVRVERSLKSPISRIMV